MGDVRRKHNLYSRPKKLFDKARIEAENLIVESFGLKSKREIWKAQAKIARLRSQAKRLIPKEESAKREFYAKLNKMGLNITSIADVLGLKTENWLERRLQTIVFRKGIAKTAKEARQMITHKNILVNGNVVNIPSYMVDRDMESKITKKVKGEKA
jgi:small subunit ribosomal protein S4